MGYTKRKIRGINFSFLLAGLVFACWALVCAWYGWPRGFRGGSAAGFSVLAFASVFFTAFPAIWARYPRKHPVIHELLRYGKFSEISRRLDCEMQDNDVEVIGPFRFTKSMLVYDVSFDLQLVPYDQIVAAEIEQSSNDEPVAIVVHTRNGRQFQWYRTFMQGRFDPEETLKKIRAAVHLDEKSSATNDQAATSDPSMASQSPSAAG